MAKEISYIIGKKSYTPKRNVLDKENLKIIEKQFSLSIPLITGAKINNKKKETNIFIGKEIDLQEFFYKKYLLEKYDVSLDMVIDMALEGFKKACLLNYKKYDQALIGLTEKDVVVPDFYSFRQKILEEINEAN